MKESVTPKTKMGNPTVSLHDEESKIILYIKKWELSFSLGSVVQ